jgi:DNA polymerase-4
MPKRKGVEITATTSGATERKFIHVDMDSFFVSVELLDAPHLAQRPVAVGGTVAERGVISTANYIARASGVKSGLATASAYRLCPDLVLLPTRFEAYEAITQKLDEIFKRYTQQVEFLSLDEASLDVTGQIRFSGSATHMAAHIRATIEHELGLTASAGVAPLKYLAKIASELQKPNGMFVITPNQVRDFLDELDLRKVPGVGPKTYAVLENLGCRKCKDITEDKIPALMRYLGVHGFYVWERCQGIEEYDERVCDTKSVGIERTLPHDCHTLPDCLNELDRLMEALRQRVGEMDNEYSIIKNQVKLKFSDFSTTSTEAPKNILCSHTATSLCRLLWDSRRDGRAVRLIGLSVKVRKKVQDDIQLAFPW